MADMDADWPLPRPVNRLKKAASQAHAVPQDSGSIASTFSSLATPIVAEAAQRVRELATQADAEGFHQLRVAFRRLRALYWAYAPYLGEEATVHATGEFKRLAAVAGVTRDWDIVGDLLTKAQASRASLALLAAAAQRKREQAVVHSREMLEGSAVEAFLQDALLSARSRLQAGDADVAVAEFADLRIKRAARAMKKRCKYASRTKPAQEEELHDVRKAGKKLRYLLEFFQPLVTHVNHRSVKQLASVQKKLGEFNDIVASQSLIRETTLEEVPVEIVDESLQWLEKQKKRRMRTAAQQVRTIARAL